MSRSGKIQRAELAARYLGGSIDDLRLSGRELDDVDATYYWQPIRGGGALIVGDDGQVLFANSSVAFKTHVEAYAQGKRTDPSLFGA